MTLTILDTTGEQPVTLGTITCASVRYLGSELWLATPVEADLTQSLGELGIAADAEPDHLIISDAGDYDIVIG
jgi:hypothetical protein